MVTRELWAAMAASLGLALRPAFAPFDPDQTFAHHLRSIRNADEPASVTQWMTGSWTVDGRIVRVLVVLDGTASQPRTHVLAEVDPPKLAGLFVRPAGFMLRNDDEQPPLGDRIEATMAVPSVAMYLASETLRRAIEPLEHFPFVMTDSSVMITVSAHIDDSGALSAALDNVGRAAAELGLHLFPIEPLAVSAFRPAATATGLLHDQERFRLTGELARLETTIAFEGRRERIDTVAHAKFWRPIGLDLAVEKASALQFLTRLFGGVDIEVGDRTFDSVFVVKGLPNRSNLVKDFFVRRPELRSALVALATMADTFTFDDRHLEVSWKRPVDADTMTVLCKHIESLGRAMEAQPDRPYR